MCEEADLQLKLNYSHGPIASFVLYFIDKNKNLFSEYYEINVNRLFRYDLSLNFDKNVYEPGENVSINILTQPNSTVALYVIDKSVELLGNENSFDSYLVKNQLNTLKLSSYAPETNVIKKDDVYGKWEYPKETKNLHNQGLIVMNNLNNLKLVFKVNYESNLSFYFL